MSVSVASGVTEGRMQRKAVLQWCSGRLYLQQKAVLQWCSGRLYLQLKAVL